MNRYAPSCTHPGLRCVPLSKTKPLADTEEACLGEDTETLQDKATEEGLSAALDTEKAFSDVQNEENTDKETDRAVLDCRPTSCTHPGLRCVPLSKTKPLADGTEEACLSEDTETLQDKTTEEGLSAALDTEKAFSEVQNEEKTDKEADRAVLDCRPTSCTHPGLRWVPLSKTKPLADGTEEACLGGDTETLQDNRAELDCRPTSCTHPGLRCVPLSKTKPLADGTKNTDKETDRAELD
jgi:hypothetical protein